MKYEKNIFFSVKCDSFHRNKMFKMLQYTVKLRMLWISMEIMEKRFFLYFATY